MPVLGGCESSVSCSSVRPNSRFKGLRLARCSEAANLNAHANQCRPWQLSFFTRATFTLEPAKRPALARPHAQTRGLARAHAHSNARFHASAAYYIGSTGRPGTRLTCETGAHWSPFLRAARASRAIILGYILDTGESSLEWIALKWPASGREKSRGVLRKICANGKAAGLEALSKERRPKS